MGGGVWDVNAWAAAQQARQATGAPTFAHSDDIYSGRRAPQVHELLDPTTKAGPTSQFAGQVMREVVPTAEHPDPVGIAVVLDVTGSNYEAAVAVHGKLPMLFGLLQRRGYVRDPQINCLAVGDAFSDNVPLQVGQFESDQRIDTQLEAMYLEGNGGGQMRETYELAAGYLAWHTSLPRRGYAFFIGDEMPYDAIRNNYGRHTLASLTGDTIEAPIPTEQAFAALQERYNTFFLFQRQGYYAAEQILPAWKALLGERALVLEDPTAVCEFIAGILAMFEGGLDANQAVYDLQLIGADPSAVQAAGQALVQVQSAGSVALTSGNLPTGRRGRRGTSRL